jgi:hypothetical protein
MLPKALVLTAVLQGPQAEGAVQGVSSEQQVVPQVVGSAEVSFDRSTHSSYLTLNPPTRCAYLCNMVRRHPSLSSNTSMS